MPPKSLVKRNPVLATFYDVFNWYPGNLSAVERRLLFKLDISILIFASLSFFCKFLDQSNITNAYVSGLKEDLHLYGNELNYFNVAYYSAYIVGQLPMVLLQSRPTIAPYLLPSLEIIWAILTFAQAEATKVWHFYLLRALVGFFEAPSFAGTHFVLGSWYRKEELFKRAGVWFMGNSLGSMFSGYLQAAAYRNLNGVHGKTGYQWLFIIDGVITLPIAFLGFALFPGLPASRKPWFLTTEEYALAKTRMPSDHRQAGPLNLSVAKRTLKNYMFYLFIFIYISLIQASYFASYMALWLKSLTPKYSIPQVNVYPTFVNLLSAMSSWLGTTLAQSVSPAWLYSFSTACSLFGTIILTVWNVSDGLKFAAFYIGGGIGIGMTSPILYSFVNVVFRHDPEQRAVTIASMMTFGYTSFAVIPLYTFATVDAPRFTKGYPTTVAFVVVLYVSFLAAFYLGRRIYNAPNRQPSQLTSGEQPLTDECGSSTPDLKIPYLDKQPPSPALVAADPKP